MKNHTQTSPCVELYYSDSVNPEKMTATHYEIYCNENKSFSEIRIPFNHSIRKGYYYILKFQVYPAGFGTLRLGYAAENFQEWRFSGIWDECWHSAYYSFQATENDENGALRILVADKKNLRKIEFANLALDEYAEPVMQPSSNWQIFTKQQTACFMNPSEELRGINPDCTLNAEEKFIDFCKLSGLCNIEGRAAVASCTVISDADDKTVLLPIAGDYILDVFLNDLHIENSTGTDRLRVMKLRLDKGENRLLIVCRAGLRRWYIRLGTEYPQLHTEFTAFHLPGDSLVSDQYPFPGKQTFSLAGEWELAHTDEYAADDTVLPDLTQKEWRHIQMPQELHWALYHAGEIEHPYYGLNAKDCRWIETRSWWLRRRFILPENLSGKLVLNLESVDYYAHYWLNGIYLGASEGAFCGVAAKIDSTVKRGEENELVIRLECAGEKLDYPGGTVGSKLLKGHVLAGWSAAAKDFNTAGLLQPVYITERKTSLTLERPFVQTRSLTGEAAYLECSVEVRTDDPADYGCPLEITVSVEDITETLNFSPQAGMSIVNLPVCIRSPRLWWPNGMGAQEMYSATFELRKNGIVLDTLQVSFGIRLLERRQGGSIKNNYDSNNWISQNFYLGVMRERGDYTSGDWNFFINGKPFFVKGCNWMPIDTLGDFSDERYDWHLALAKDAGIQMFRVWGAGIPETDHFYGLCDRLGILIMQDLPINVSGKGKNCCLWEKMLAWHIFRLRNHPSLAYWCGGNEFSPENYDNAPLIVIASNLIRTLDGSHEFLEGSPVNGDFHSYPSAADPAYFWKTELSRAPFVSECGSRGMPMPDTWREILPTAEQNAILGDTGFNPQEIAQRYPDIFHFFGEFPQEMFLRAEKYADIRHAPLEKLAIAINLGAAEADRLAIEVCRYAYPQNGGLLLWAWKRPWPTVACQLIDGMDRPIPTYYETRKAYRSCWPILKLDSHKYEAGKPIALQVALLDENACGGTVSVRIFDPLLQQVFEKKQFIDVNPITRHGDGIPFEYQIPESFAGNCFYIVLDIYKNNEIIRNVYYFYTQKALTCGGMASFLNAAQTSLKMETLHCDGNCRTVRVTNIGKNASVLTNIYSETGEVIRCSDNFFWLDVQESKELTVVFKNSNVSKLNIASWNAEKTIFESCK